MEKFKNIEQLVKKNVLPLIFTLVGAVAGFLYWKFVGCKTGSCPIKSNWYLMVLYGVLAGYLVGDLVKGVIEKRRK
jgi:hypothetical protein